MRQKQKNFLRASGARWGAQPPRLLFGAPRAEHEGVYNGESHGFSHARANREGGRAPQFLFRFAS